MTEWTSWVLAALAFAGVVVQVALLLNVHKLLARVSSIRRELEAARSDGAGTQLAEAVTQLQSAAVSLDRIAMRCDAIEQKLDVLAARPSGTSQGDPGVVAHAIRESLQALHAPVAEIRDRLARTEVERLGDEVRRSLYTRGFDTVTLLTDLSTVPRAGEARVQVEVVREGVKSKGWVVVRDGVAGEAKISPTYEMFP